MRLSKKKYFSTLLLSAVIISNGLFLPSISFAPVYAASDIQKKIKVDDTQVPNLLVHQKQLDYILPEFEKYVHKAMQDWNAPGVAIAIVKDGKIVYEKGFGVRKVGTKDLVNEMTEFQIASLSKNMLAHVIAKLVEQGVLSFDDPVQKYNPQFRLYEDGYSSQFTIRDCLSHRSGLPHFSGDTLWYMGFSHEEMLSGLSKLPFKSQPRTQYGYQNQLFGLTSKIAEKVTGKSIEVLYKEIIFDPLQMTTAHVSYENINPSLWSWEGMKRLFSKANIATPHDHRNHEPHALAFSKLNYLYAGSTGVSISVHDYSKWLQVMLTDGVFEEQRLFDKKLMHELKTAHIHCEFSDTDPMFAISRYHNVHYGLGYFRFHYGTKDRNVLAYSHMGAFYGVRSLMLLMPSEKMGIVILSNLGSNRISLLPEGVMNRFMDLYLGLEDIDWSEQTKMNLKDIQISNKRYKAMERMNNPQPSGPLEAYVGTYNNDVYGECRVSLENNALTMTYRGKTVQLTHFNGHQFSFAGNILSPAYCEHDTGYVFFGGRKPQAIELMQIPSLLREGFEEGLFEKKK